MNDIEVREVVSPADPAIAAIKRIYESSFPPEQRVDDDLFDALLEDRVSDTGPKDEIGCLLVAVSGDSVLGFACGYLYLTSDVAAVYLGYLLYLAVDTKLRGGGVGSKLYQAVSAILQTAVEQRDGVLAGLIFEVERPELASGQDRLIRKRRLAFYQRFGAAVVPGINYVMPPVGPGMPSAPMHLMFQPIERQWEARDLCRLFYKIVYGYDDSHPLVRQALGG